MSSEQSFLSRFFNVAIQGRTYLNLIYLLLMLPLGILYFTIVVTGFSLSLGLIFIVIGFFIAFFFLFLVQGISTLHLNYASALLGFEPPPKIQTIAKESGFTKKLKEIFADVKTYTSLIYMFIELPLGIIYFTLIITFTCLSITFSLSPILWILQEDGAMNFSDSEWLFYVDFDETILLMIIGVVLFFSTLHLGNFFAKIEELLCKNLLALH